ncbi:hypothetical protein LNTAR_24783 [Lentisphaera araneosa HTCC2155]|uniref:Uncharacterized protein n=1 Tax=Lentisphaera araneosa HTCC2155 TaxID=313628 RepID=A6DSW4_9BACT|nr:hypothetical protein [Lentisphaera araneosa]EDM25254.1 hypothetical protein LNTAR_24783 [Lentisphaera araneosa HTCC2155]
MGIILGTVAGVYSLYDSDRSYQRQIFNKDWDTIKLYFNFSFWVGFGATVLLGFKFYKSFTDFLKMDEGK